eukprot:Hpha_TRINITY_DN16630_c2_g1::TRINITY_DN16630_c2_g1_i6::g.178268::m.178268
MRIFHFRVLAVLLLLTVPLVLGTDTCEGKTCALGEGCIESSDLTGVKRCTLVCQASDARCLNRADAAEYVPTKPPGQRCECHCRNQYETTNYNVQCSVCPLQYDESKDCGECFDGYINYPTCTECTVQTHCSNRASKVGSDAAHTKCECVCENHWDGADCSSCPIRYDQNSCDDCAVGYIQKPVCTLCEPAVHCSDHGSVTDDGTRSSCKCTCRNQWTGSDCSNCDTTKYNSGKDCGECVDGRVNYP